MWIEGKRKRVLQGELTTHAVVKVLQALLDIRKRKQNKKERKDSTSFNRQAHAPCSNMCAQHARLMVLTDSANRCSFL